MMYGIEDSLAVWRESAQPGGSAGRSVRYKVAASDEIYFDINEYALDDGDKAIENPNQRTASEKWQKHFGDRYPCHLANDELEETNVYDAPAIIKASAKSS